MSFDYEDQFQNAVTAHFNDEMIIRKAGAAACKISHSTTK